MADRYECDINVRPLEKKIKDFTHQHGYDLARVFDDLLDYIIAFFDVTGKPIEGWRYSSEENEVFCDLMKEYFTCLNGILSVKKRPWYDAWGDLFMSLHPSSGGRGQFFTPDEICNLMACITSCNGEPKASHITPFGARVMINDCSAGSSRNLLAAHAIFIENKWNKPYLIAEDIDYTCCKMSAINMAVHGCFGEVICHNTLTEPTEFHSGFMVNECLLANTAFPSIRRITQKERFPFVKIQENINKERDNQRLEYAATDQINSKESYHSGGEPTLTTENTKERKQPQQLSIW